MDDMIYRMNLDFRSPVKVLREAGAIVSAWGVQGGKAFLTFKIGARSKTIMSPELGKHPEHVFQRWLEEVLASRNNFVEKVGIKPIQLRAITENGVTHIIALLLDEAVPMGDVAVYVDKEGHSIAKYEYMISRGTILKGDESDYIIKFVSELRNIVYPEYDVRIYRRGIQGIISDAWNCYYKTEG